MTDEVRQRLENLSRARGLSLNAVVLEILDAAVGTDERRHRLTRYATWTPEELQDFNETLTAQRTVDAFLWH